MSKKRMTLAKRLYREHNRLVGVMFVKHGGTLPRSDRKRLDTIRAKLDDIETREMRPILDRMQRMVEEAQDAAKGVSEMLEMIRPYIPTEPGTSGLSMPIDHEKLLEPEGSESFSRCSWGRGNG